MKINKLSYVEFKGVVDECKIKLINVYSWYEEIVRYFYVNKDQSCICRITNSNYLDLMTTDIYEEFGITSSSLVSYKCSYILYVNPLEDLKSQIVTGLDNIPEDKEPTHLVVVTDDRVSILETYEKVKSIYPKIKCMQGIDREIDSSVVLENIGLTLGTDKLYDCIDICNHLNSIDRKSLEYLEEFSKTVDRIFEESKGKIIVYSGDNSNVLIYQSIVVEMYLRYNKSCYASRNMVPYIVNSIMDSLFSTRTMLFEDVVNYFNNLPRLLIETTSYGIIYNIVKSKRMILRISYTDIESDDTETATVEAFNLKDLDIKSIYNFYNIDSIDGCDRLKEKFIELYKILKLKKDIIDVTKIVIFSKDNRINIGYIDDIQITVDVRAFNKDIGSIDKVLDYDDLRTCVPADIYLDGIPQAKFIFDKLLNTEFDLKYIRPIKNNRRLTEVLSISSIRKSEDWSNTSLSISTIGLYSKFDLVQRSGFIENFIKVMGLDKARRAVDCFGGFNPLLVSTITLGGK